MGLSALALIASIAIAGSVVRQGMIDDRIDRLRAVVGTTIGVAQSLEDQVVAHQLAREQAIEQFRKLGLGAPGLGEFNIMIEVKDLAQLEQAFERVASRRDPVEGFHNGVNSLVQNAVFALYRDFPDAFRHRGEERF